MLFPSYVHRVFLCKPKNAANMIVFHCSWNYKYYSVS